MVNFFINLNPIIQALLATIFTWEITAIGASLVFFFKNINKTLLDRPLRSLDGNTPKEVFIKVFDEDIFNKLF